jgi:uncharacterized protein (DUF2249 family)
VGEHAAAPEQDSDHFFVTRPSFGRDEPANLGLPQFVSLVAPRRTLRDDGAMAELDVRLLQPREKHPTIHRMLGELAPGEALQITNDHDPRPLRFELEADYPGVYAWEYLEQGPEIWRVAIRKAAA